METLIASIPPRAIQASSKGAPIVVVEDPFIQKYLRTMLARHGFQVVGSDARTAIRTLQSAPEPMGVVITNSPLDFLPFADTVRLLYMAAAPDPELASCFSHCRVVKKPFHPDELVALVNDLTASV
jgi:hypothetical protein